MSSAIGELLAAFGRPMQRLETGWYLLGAQAVILHDWRLCENAYEDGSGHEDDRAVRDRRHRHVRARRVDRIRGDADARADHDGTGNLHAFADADHALSASAASTGVRGR